MKLELENNSFEEAWRRLAVAEDAEDAVWEGAQPEARWKCESVMSPMSPGFGVAFGCICAPVELSVNMLMFSTSTFFDLSTSSNPLTEIGRQASLPLERHAGLQEFVENDAVPFKSIPASLPELEELPDEDMLAPVKTMPSNQPELEDVEEDELVPLKTISGQEDQNMCEERARVLVQAESEGMVEDHQITGPKPEAGSSNPGDSALFVGQTWNESETPVDEHLRHLLLVEELVVVFNSHRWNGESEEQLVRLKEDWHEKRNMTTAEATHCAVEARMRARLERCDQMLLATLVTE